MKKIQKEGSRDSRLPRRLLQIGDAERRRAARLLHDTVGQHLAALQMNLTVFLDSAATLEPRARQALKDCLSLAQASVSGTRTVSYGLYPPLLAEAGLNAALQAHLKAENRRSGASLALEAWSDLDALPEETQFTLFLIFRNGLAKSPKRVAMVRRDEWLEISMAGFASGLEAGESSEIRERVHALGGTIHVSAAQLRAKLPIPARKSSSKAGKVNAAVRGR